MAVTQVDARPSPTRRGLKPQPDVTGAPSHQLRDARPSPTRRGLKPVADRAIRRCSTADARPSPTRRGLKRRTTACAWASRRDARPSPTRRGLKQASCGCVAACRRGCKTIPYEKGTETPSSISGGEPPYSRRVDTIPFGPFSGGMREIRAISLRGLEWLPGARILGISETPAA